MNPPLLSMPAPRTAAMPPATAPSQPAALCERLGALSDAGVLRHLDSSFAAFIAGLDPQASPDTRLALILASAMLSHLEGRGHSCMPLAALAEQDAGLFGWPEAAQADIAALWQALPASTDGWLRALRGSPVVQRAGHDPELGQPLVVDGPDHAPRLYLRRYWQYERSVSQAVTTRCASISAPDEAAVRHWLERLFGIAADTADAQPDWQKIACAIALRAGLTIITGGPGTGKTYTAARLLALLFATSGNPERLRIALAAPTGKAAARLKQSIDSALQALQLRLGETLDLAALMHRTGAARTLHSLLGARPDTRRFRHHAGHPLDVDVVIVDEASMVHLEMMAALLEALPADARLILLGDKDQLASVEAGAVLGDLCRDAEAGHYSAETARYVGASAGDTLPADYLAREAHPSALAQQTVMLRESRRFDGPIGALASAVNSAADPTAAARILEADSGGALLGRTGVPAAEVIGLALDGRPGAPACYRDYLMLLAQRPERHGDGDAGGDEDAAHRDWAMRILRAFDRFRILCAVRAGEWGVEGINRAIVDALAGASLLSPRGSWYPGRPVMVTRNDPALGVFNGDIGITLPAPGNAASLRAYFSDGDTLRSVSVSRLAHVETAFAMTVHKSQGSEFEHTALVLSAHSGGVLTRELIYTGITRARTAFTLFAERPGLLEEGIKRVTRRESGLLAEAR